MRVSGSPRLVAAWVTALLTAPVLAGGDGIPGRPEDVHPILVGAKVPAATLRTATGATFELGRELATGPAILVFFRGGWCPYCTAHLSQLQTLEPKLVELGYRILAISPDSPDASMKLAQKDVRLTLLSDSAMAAASGFGIAYRVDPQTLAKLSGYGIDLEKASGMAHHQLPVPAVFVVRDGVVRFQYVNPDYKTRLNPAVLEAAARAALDP